MIKTSGRLPKEIQDKLTRKWKNKLWKLKIYDQYKKDNS